MSQPAAKVQTSRALAPAPAVPSAPRPPRSSPYRPTPSRRPQPRRGTVGFSILSAVVVGSMVLGLVTLNALLAQSSFRVDDLQERIGALSQENLELRHEQATLSAPGRIVDWARSHGMRLPDDIRFLHVPGSGPAAPAGGADDLARIERRLKRILEEGD